MRKMSMKKLLLAAVAAATFTTPALADNTLTYNLDADVGSICGVFKFDGPTVQVNFGELALTPSANEVSAPAGSATYRCNNPGGFTRTISSANSGKLVRDGSSGDALNSIAYTFQHGGGSGLGVAATQLTAPITSTHAGSGAFLAGQTGSVTFRVNGVQAAPGGNNAPGTTVFAGNYTDIVTISVTGL
jgi:spore coat protein U-like protein